MKIVNVSLLSIALLGSACGDGPESAAPGPRQERASKALTATDQAGKNTVELEVGSDDPGVLAAYGPGSFVVEPFGPAEAQSELRADGQDPAATQAQPLSEGGASGQANERVSLKIIREQLAPGVSGYRLVDRTQPSYRDPFVVVYRYTFQDCAMVTRVSTFNNVYASIESQQEASGAWSTIAYRTDLQKNDPLDVCDPGSYQLKARIERRNANDYEFSGHN